MDIFLQKYRKYKEKYVLLKKDYSSNVNSSYTKINSILDNLDDYYQSIKNIIGDQEGGKKNNSNSKSNIKNKKIDKNKLKKYKNIIKSSINTIKFLKSMAEQYYVAYLQTNNYYANVLNNLKLKKEQLENVQSKINHMNDVNTSNIEKIAMLETMMGTIEKLVNTPMNIDLNLTSSINGKKLSYDTKTSVREKLFNETFKDFNLSGGYRNIQAGIYRNIQTGGMDLDEFNENLSADLQSLKAHANDIESNKTFVSDRIATLNERMKAIVESNNNLFDIRARVEWIVDKLEKNTGEHAEPLEEKDYEDMYNQMKAIINDVKSKGNMTEDVGNYIIDLEKYVSYIKNMIESTNSTLQLMSLEDFNNSGKYINEQGYVPSESPTEEERQGDGKRERERESEGLGESGYRKYVKQLYGGADPEVTGNELKPVLLKDVYDNYFISEFENQKNYILSLKSTLDNIEINDSIDSTNSTNSIIHGLRTQTLLMLNELNSKISDTKNLINIINNINLLWLLINFAQHNLIDSWESVFSTRNTDYYNRFLNYDIYNFGSTIIQSEESELESESEPEESKQITESIKVGKFLLSFINEDKIKSILGNKLFINLNLDNEDEFNNLINLINNSTVFLNLFNYMILNLILIYQVQTYNTENQNIINRIMKEKYDVLIKNITLASFKEFNNLFNLPITSNEELSGGRQLIDSQIVLSENVTEIDIGTYYEFLKEFIHFNKTDPELPIDQIVKKIAGKEMDRIKSLDKIMINLYDKVLLKLGKENTLKIIKGNYDNEDNFEKFFEDIKRVQAEENQVFDSSQIGGSSKPRLDPFRVQLLHCEETLKPFVKNVNRLDNLIKIYSKGKEIEDSENLNSLISIYDILNTQISNGINSYIKLSPLIFFSIEFPPEYYKTDLCKYQFLFNPITEIVSYKIDGSCVDQNPIQTKSHAGFFKSNNKDTTQDLITDPVIGLKKLIESNSEKNAPENKIINMMFSLGASGTGKTTRYFGKKDADNPKDRNGIVTEVIKSAREKGSRVSFSYFVCYGQKKSLTDPISPEFDEILLFFNPNEILSNEGSQSRYIPFKMNLTPSVVDPENNYTQFYVELMKKKMNKLSWEKLEKFIKNGEDFQDLQDLQEAGEGYNFRNILEQVEEIWLDVNSSTDLNTVFESLLREQKVIHTILPTKNNIESSRGHTCVLIKIKNSEGIKYFPLFDMAGTENPTDMESFLKQGKNPQKMSKFIKIISENTQNNTIIDDSNNKFSSLNDMISFPSVSQYLTPLAQEGGSMQKLSTIEFGDQQDKSQEAELFLDKIIKEGYYINHTIGMLIFTAMCVGYSINTTKEGDTDNFNYFDTKLFKDMTENVCFTPKQEGCVNKPQILYSNLTSYFQILNSSCIWTQILFSFLYWNNETLDSSKVVLENFMDGKYNGPYLCDVTDGNVYGIDFDNIKSNIFTTYNVEQIQELKNSLESIIKKINNYNQDKIPALKIKSIIKTEGKFGLSPGAGVGIKNKIEELTEILKKYPGKDKATAVDFQNQMDKANNELNPVNIQKHCLALGKIIYPNKNNDEEVLKLFACDTFEAGISPVNIVKNTIIPKIRKLIIEKKKRLESKPDEELSGFYTETEKNINNQDILSFLDLIDESGFNELKIKKIGNQYDIFYEINGTEYSLIGLVDFIIKLDQQLLSNCKDDTVYYNQMLRIEESRISAAKMALMLLVTGQEYKHEMVKETMVLNSILFDSTNIVLSE